jgi:hypothetical protein
VVLSDKGECEVAALDDELVHSVSGTGSVSSTTPHAQHTQTAQTCRCECSDAQCPCQHAESRKVRIRHNLEHSRGAMPAQALAAAVAKDRQNTGDMW